MALGGLGAGGGVNTCSRCARFGCMAARCGSGSVRALPLGKYSGHDSQLTGRYSTLCQLLVYVRCFGSAQALDQQ